MTSRQQERFEQSNGNSQRWTLTAMLMNPQGRGCCPGVEPAAECELSPRGEGANKTQHNTNRPLGWYEPADQPTGQPAGRLVWQQSPSVKTSWDNGESHALDQQRCSEMCFLSGQFYQQKIFVPDWLPVLQDY